jgi:hypothetical protein
LKTKKRHGERGPGVKTLLTRAALDAAAAQPDLQPKEFLLSVMRDPKAEAKWRMDAAKALLPKQTGAPTDPGAGAVIIDAIDAIPEAKERLARRADLAQRSFRALMELEPSLSRDERAELETLNVWRAALPEHLRGRKTLGERVGIDPPAKQRIPHVDPGEHRRRLLSERHAIVEVKSTARVNEPLGDEVAPDPIVEDDLPDYE